MTARFTCFLVKIASRCNLACDYCYVYEHADQTWRSLPRVLSEGHQDLVARRISEYASAEGIDEAVVVLHGGEPLLAGADTLARFAVQVRSEAPPGVRISVSMQTNGLLLDERSLETLEAEDISISLSHDGPRHANDLHRLTPRGRSSFDRVTAALTLLEEHPQSFAGVIAVIDPRTSPADLLEFFAGYDLPQLDLLLPDANHMTPPAGRSDDAGLYVRWLVEAFDIWFDRFPRLPLRFFDEALRVVAGLPSSTDAFGLGDVSLLTIETDGSYHDLDVLKITEDGRTATGLTLEQHSIADAAASPVIDRHRRLLRPQGLSKECQACPELHTCGGGSVPHRFASDGFTHPTVYCTEMKTLLGHARRRLHSHLKQSGEPAASEPPLPPGFDYPDLARPVIDDIVRSWSQQAAAAWAELPDAPAQSAIDALASETLTRVLTHPVAVIQLRLLQDADRRTVTRTTSGRAIDPPRAPLSDHPEWADDAGLRAHVDDRWLRAPFDPPIVFEHEGDVVAAARHRLAEAIDLIGRYSPALLAEMHALSREVQFVRDIEASVDKCVSFSDDVVPGALYVGVRGMTADGLIDAIDLADSLIHEHRHQKLYLLQRRNQLVLDDSISVPSPWRADLRPPSGLLHAAFVFVELHRFWQFIDGGSELRPQTPAGSQIGVIESRLATAFTTLAGCPLTTAGHQLVRELSQAHQERVA